MAQTKMQRQGDCGLMTRYDQMRWKIQIRKLKREGNTRQDAKDSTGALLSLSFPASSPRAPCHPLPGFGLAMTSRVRGEGNGTPLQSSCLETPMDGGAWWAAVGHDWSDLAAAAARVRKTWIPTTLLSTCTTSESYLIIGASVFLYVNNDKYIYFKSLILFTLICIVIIICSTVLDTMVRSFAASPLELS